MNVGIRHNDGGRSGLDGFYRSREARRCGGEELVQRLVWMRERQEVGLTLPIGP
jgi:hypothetical protein